MQVVDLVLFRGSVAAPLRGDDVHHRRPFEPADLAQRPFDVRDVVAVDRSRVFDAQILEEGPRRDQLFQALLHSPDRLDRLVAGGKGAQHAVDAILGGVISGVEHRQLLRQVLRQAADGGRVRSTVVVDDDDHRCLFMPDVVERFVSHSAGQRAIAHHDDHPAVVALTA